MPTIWRVGLAVQTPFGKGVVREVRNRGQILVEVHERALLVHEADVSPIESRGTARRAPRGRADIPALVEPPTQSSHVPIEYDLHGLTVEEALSRASQAVNDALLANLPHVRFIHGRSGGRIRGALHRWLRETPGIQGFRLDPRNPGVTVATL